MRNKTCAIMQPTYIPWLGYFDLMDSVDSFVFLNDVQWAKWSWQVRNRIKTSQGGLFLTVPIKRGVKSRLETKINEAQINDTEMWREKHLKSIFVAYRKSRYFDEVFPFLETMIGNKSETLDYYFRNSSKDRNHNCIQKGLRIGECRRAERFASCQYVPGRGVSAVYITPRVSGLY
jgi:hypothetical protein